MAVYEPNRQDRTEEFHARIAAAVANTPYRLRRTGSGFDLTVDVNGMERRVHTYRVALRTQEKTFTMTDIVRAVEYEAGLGEVRLGKTVSVGRSVYIVKARPLDGSGQWYTFRSADGHRLIRGVAQELGWQEVRPTSVKVAIGFGVFGGAVALATLIALAVVFWL